MEGTSSLSLKEMAYITATQSQWTSNTDLKMWYSLMIWNQSRVRLTVTTRRP